MSSFDEIVKAVADVSPKFNNFALTEFVRETIDSAPEFIAVVFREGMKLVDADIKFKGYRILSPEERVKFELASPPGKPRKAKVPLTVSHLRLVEYSFEFEGKRITTTLYTPYLSDNMLLIKDKRSMIRKVILEKTFSRVSERDKDGLSVSPIRVNMTFNRRQTFHIQSYVTGDRYSHFLVTGRLFYGKGGRKICDTTILHYMLAKFGFNETLRRFGLSKNDVSFVEVAGTDTNKYEYFWAKNFKSSPEDGLPLFLKVKKDLLVSDSDQALKLVVNILYVLSFFDIQDITNVYHKDGAIWKIFLGIILFDDRAELKAHGNAETHLKSVDTNIDPVTRARFHRFGVPIEDIYDLLVHIFINIDEFMVNNLVQDIYNSRLDVSNGLLVGSYATKIFWNIYYLAKKTNITERDVKSALNFNSMLFKMASSSGKKDDAEHYIAPPEIVGDNFLFSGGLNKIRLGGKAEQRLHPSMVTVESISAFVGKHIGKTGYINPYVPTDEHGAILHPEYTAEIDKILSYLPR